MKRDDLIEKIERGGYSQEQLIKWIKHVEGNNFPKPLRPKIGDVYMHNIFRHPVVLLGRRQHIWIGGILTTDHDCSIQLEPCRSRFFPTSYFTMSLTTFEENDPIFKFMGVYDNVTHLREVFKKLKKLMT